MTLLEKMADKAASQVSCPCVTIVPVRFSLVLNHNLSYSIYRSSSHEMESGIVHDYEDPCPTDPDVAGIGVSKTDAVIWAS
jgi:hypothetical protein